MGELSEAEKLRCVEIFRSAPALQASFPVVLSNGAAVPPMRGVCSQCQMVIDPADVHGRVSWPIPSVAVVDAAGLCRPCSRMTQLFVRFRASGRTYRAEAPRRDGHGWFSVEPTVPPWWRRLRRWLMQRVTQ